MPEKSQQNIAERWVDAATSRDAARARALLADDVEVAPPFLEQPVHGTEAAMRVFRAFIIATTEFEYGRIWPGSEATVLEFRAKVGELSLTGLDVIEVDRDGRICRFEICARPLSTISALGEEARRFLQGAVNDA